MKNKERLALESKIIKWLSENDKYVVVGKKHAARSEPLKLAAHLLGKEATIIAAMVQKRFENEKH